MIFHFLVNLLWGPAIISSLGLYEIFVYFFINASFPLFYFEWISVSETGIKWHPTSVYSFGWELTTMYQNLFWWFRYIILFNLFHQHLKADMVISFFFHEKIDLERLDNIFKVTHLISGGSGDFYWSYICIEIDFTFSVESLNHLLYSKWFML